MTSTVMKFNNSAMKGFLQYSHHVVFKAQDAVVDVQLRQLFLMNANLMLFLDLNYPGLDFLPRHVGQLRLKRTTKV